MKMKKKIAAFAAAAMMAMSLTAMSASATYDCTLEHENKKPEYYALNNRRVYGLLAVGEEGQIYNSNVDSRIFSETYYNGNVKYIRATINITRYPQGGVLDTFETLKENTTTTPSRATVRANDYYGTITVYSSNEVRLSNGMTWGAYPAIKNVQ